MTEKANSVLLVLVEAFIIFCGLVIAIAGMKALAIAYLRLHDLYFAHMEAGQMAAFGLAVAIAIWFEFYRE